MNTYLTGSAQSAIRAIQGVGEGLKETSGGGQRKQYGKKGYSRVGRKATAGQARRLQQGRQEGYSRTGRKV